MKNCQWISQHDNSESLDGIEATSKTKFFMVKKKKEEMIFYTMLIPK